VSDVDCIVFWTKDPMQMLDKFELLHGYNFYFQFTLTPYGNDIEPNLPQKTQIIDSFRKLSDHIGKKRNIWRYDPIILSDRMNIEYHVEQFNNLAERLTHYTEKCIISFLDSYRHIQSQMSNLRIRPPDESEMRDLAQEISKIAGEHNIKVETCAESVDLADTSIGHGQCIDNRLISQLTGINRKAEKDKHQRKYCECASSIDIGEYNTCLHRCAYCYANISPRKVEKNRFLHENQSPWLVDPVKERQKNSISRSKTEFLIRWKITSLSIQYCLKY